MISHIELITSKETHHLRHTVLWPHIEREEDCLIDRDNDPDAIHLGAFLDDRIIAIGSLFEMKSSKIDFQNQYRLRAMASHPDYRGSGAAKMLVLRAIEILREKQMDVLWCDARLNAVGFYERIGFSLIDEIYDVPNIGPHKFMYLPLEG